MYIKLVDADKREKKLYRVADGEAPTYGTYEEARDLPENAWPDNDYDFVDYGIDGEVKYIEFIPFSETEPLLAATSGEIYLQDDSGSTIERVR